MNLENSLKLFVGRTRWIKKWLPWRPDIAFLPLEGDRKLYVDAQDMRGPSFFVMYGGRPSFDGYERAEKDAILNHLPQNAVFLDIGANIGLFSFYVHWRRPDVTIHAFEPHPVNYSCLEASCRENQATQMHPHPVAVGERAGQLELFFDESDSGGHSIYRDSLKNNLHQTRSTKIPVETLDAYGPLQALPRIDVIKIDIQGGEAAAIRGAVKTLQRHRPALLLECDYESLLGAQADTSLIAALRSTGLGYRVRPIGDASATDFALEELEETARLEVKAGRLQGNYLFTVPKN